MTRPPIDVIDNVMDLDIIQIHDVYDAPVKKFSHSVIIPINNRNFSIPLLISEIKVLLDHMNLKLNSDVKIYSGCIKSRTFSHIELLFLDDSPVTILMLHWSNWKNKFSASLGDATYKKKI